MAGVFNLGGVLDAFSPPKMERVYTSPELQGEIGTTIGGMGQYRTQAGQSLSNYEKANREAINQARRLTQQTEGEVGGMLGGLRQSGYMSDRERARAGDLAALNQLLGQMGGGMSRADKAAASRLGYAGRPSSSYLDKQRSSYIGAFGAPIASQIFAGLNPAAAGAASERVSNINQQLGLMDYRNQMPLGLAQLELNPLQALQAARANEIAQLGGLSDVARSNLAGFKEQRNKWAAAAGAVDQSLNSALDTFMSLYSGGMVGGGGGGLLGGLLGGGKAQTAQPSRPQAAYTLPQPTYTPQPVVAPSIGLTAPIGYGNYGFTPPPSTSWGLSYSNP
jgi:hypothetical protein